MVMHTVFVRGDLQYGFHQVSTKSHTRDRTNFTALLANPTTPNVKTGGKQMPIKAWKNMFNLWHRRLDQTRVKKRVGRCKRTLTVSLYVSLFCVFIAGLDPCKALHLADRVCFYIQQGSPPQGL